MNYSDKEFNLRLPLPARHKHSRSNGSMNVNCMHARMFKAILRTNTGRTNFDGKRVNNIYIAVAICGQHLPLTFRFKL